MSILCKLFGHKPKVEKEEILLAGTMRTGAYRTKAFCRRCGERLGDEDE